MNKTNFSPNASEICIFTAHEKVVGHLMNERGRSISGSPFDQSFGSQCFVPSSDLKVWKLHILLPNKVGPNLLLSKFSSPPSDLNLDEISTRPILNHILSEMTFLTTDRIGFTIQLDGFVIKTFFSTLVWVVPKVII